MQTAHPTHQITIGIPSGKAYTRAVDFLRRVLRLTVLKPSVDERSFVFCAERFPDEPPSGGSKRKRSEGVIEKEFRVNYLVVKPRDLATELREKKIQLLVGYDDILQHLLQKNYHYKPLTHAQDDCDRTLQPRLCLIRRKIGQKVEEKTFNPPVVVSEFDGALYRTSSFQSLLSELPPSTQIIKRTGVAESYVANKLVDYGLVVVQSGATLEANDLEIVPGKEIALKFGLWCNFDDPQSEAFYDMLRANQRLLHCSLPLYHTVIIDGMDGAGKTTLVNWLKAESRFKSFIFRDRSVMTDLTLFPDGEEEYLRNSNDEKDTQKVISIILECDVSVAQARIATRSRSQGTKGEPQNAFETENGLSYFKQRFRELSAQFGLCLIDTTAISPEKVVEKVASYLLAKDTTHVIPCVDQFSQEDFNALPLVARGESKIVRLLKPSYEVIQFIPSVHSHKHQRTALVEKTDVARMRMTKCVRRLLAFHNIPHTYWYVGEKFILADALSEPPPNIELIVKGWWKGTDQYRYVGLEKWIPCKPGQTLQQTSSKIQCSHSKIKGAECKSTGEREVAKIREGNSTRVDGDAKIREDDGDVTRVEGAAAQPQTYLIQPAIEYPAPYVRFDWRNPNTHAEGDVAIAPSLIRMLDLMNVEAAEGLARRTFQALVSEFKEIGIVLQDMCFFSTKDGDRLFGELSQDNGRYLCLGEDRYFGKEVWRTGSTAPDMVKNWNEIADRVGMLTLHKFNALYCPILSRLTVLNRAAPRVTWAQLFVPLSNQAKRYTQGIMDHWIRDFNALDKDKGEWLLVPSSGEVAKADAKKGELTPEPSESSESSSGEAKGVVHWGDVVVVRINMEYRMGETWHRGFRLISPPVDGGRRRAHLSQAACVCIDQEPGCRKISRERTCKEEEEPRDIRLVIASA